MPLTAIIVIHRSPGRMPGCLEAIRACTNGEYRLLVIDAAPGRDSQSDGRWRGDGDLQVIDSRGGKRAVKACNTVLKQGKWHQVYMVGSTIRVADGWIEALGRCLETAPQAGLVGPLMDSHYAGLQIPLCTPTDLAGSTGDLNAALQSRCRNQRVAVRNPGVGCLGGKLATVRALGYLDETCEDMDVALADLCLRAEMAGYQNYLAGDILVAADKRVQSHRWQKALRDKWESLEPESDRRKHYEALSLCAQAHQARQRENLDRAVELYLEGIGLFPAEHKLYLDLADMLAATGRIEDALQTLQEMPDEPSRPAGELITAICRRDMAQPEQARSVVDRLLSADDGCAAGWWLQGALQMDAGQPDRAERSFRKSIALDPGFGDSHTALGKLKADHGASTEALDWLERGFVLSPDVDRNATAYHAAISQGQDYRRALPFFLAAAAICRSSRRLRYLLIDILLKSGQPDLAMGVIESALVDFSPDEGLLTAALAVREQLADGPLQKNGSTVCFCLIVRDEETDLPRCLHSIKPVADEIVIVDTGSRDRTRDIARVFGARVYDFKWCDDFAAAKNFAARQARARWIFSIDADEVLSPLDHEAVRLLLQRPASDPVAYAVTTRNYLKLMDVIGWQPNDGHYPEEAGLGWMPSEKVRLFPNDRRLHFVYPVHEMVEPSLEAAGIPVVACDIPVHHYGKLNYARSQAKGATYYKIGLKKLEALQDSPTGIRELAIQAQTLGDYPEAARLWEHLLTLEPGRAHTYINLGTVYLELGEYAKALQMARQAQKMDPAIKESHFNLALSMFYRGDARGAIGVLEQLVEQQPDYFAARFILAAACCCAGEDEQARAALGKLQHTGIAAGLPEAAHTLAQGMEKAGQSTFARALQTLIPV